MSSNTTTLVFYRRVKARRLAGNPLVPIPGGDIDILSSVMGVNFVEHDSSPRKYRDLLRNGLNATTDASGVDDLRAVFEPGSIRIQKQAKLPINAGNNLEELVDGQLLWFFPIGLGAYSMISSLTTAKNRSLTDLYQNLAAVESSFKGMVFTGEIRESLRMIKSPASALRRGVSDYLGSLRKRVPRRASRGHKRKIVADTWLEYAYGWKPLVADIDSGIEAFYRSQTVRSIFQMIRGKGYVQKAANSTPIGYMPPGYIVGVMADTIRREQIIVKHYGILSSDGSGIADSHSYGWSPTEFIPTLWELLPYSFLVDYFTNIGDIISSWSYRHIGLRWLSRTTIEEIAVETTSARIVSGNSPNDPTYDFIVTGQPGSARTSKMRWNRVASVPISLPSLELEVPGMRSTKWINIAALTTSLALTRKQLNP